MSTDPILVAAVVTVLISSLFEARKYKKMSQAFDALKAEVALSKLVMAHAADVITKLLAKVPDPENVVDPVEVASVTSGLGASVTALDAAVVAADPPVDPARV